MDWIPLDTPCRTSNTCSMLVCAGPVLPSLVQYSTDPSLPRLVCDERIALHCNRRDLPPYLPVPLNEM